MVAIAPVREHKRKEVRKMTLKIIAVGVIVSLLAGCDVDSDNSQNIELLRLERQRETAEQNARLDALKDYVTGKVDLIKEQVISVSNLLASTRMDADELEKIITEITKERDANGKELSYEVKILRLLKHDKVNKLAIKYLSTGFSAQAESFMSMVRDAREAENRYQDEVRKVMDRHGQAMKASQNWVGMSKNQKDSEIRRLNNEIRALERKLTATRREMIGGVSQQREWRMKMLDYEHEIFKKRHQMDYLRNPNANRDIETAAAKKRMDTEISANYEKRQELSDVDRRLKPKTSVTEIAEKINQETLNPLRLSIKTRIETLECEKKDLDRKMISGREIIVEIRISGPNELNRLKVRADKELSLQPKKP